MGCVGEETEMVNPRFRNKIVVLTDHNQKLVVVKDKKAQEIFPMIGQVLS